MSKPYDFLKSKVRSILEVSTLLTLQDFLESWISQNHWVAIFLIIFLIVTFEVILIKIWTFFQKKTWPPKKGHSCSCSQKSEDSYQKRIKFDIKNCRDVVHLSSEHRINIFSERITSALAPEQNEDSFEDSILSLDEMKWAGTSESELRVRHSSNSSSGRTSSSSSLFHSKLRKCFLSLEEHPENEYDTIQFPSKESGSLMKSNKKRNSRFSSDLNFLKISEFTVANGYLDVTPCPSAHLLLPQVQVRLVEENVKNQILLKPKAVLKNEATNLCSRSQESLVQNRHSVGRVTSPQARDSFPGQNANQNEGFYEAQSISQAQQFIQNQRPANRQPDTTMSTSFSIGTEDSVHAQDVDRRQQFFKAPVTIEMKNAIKGLESDEHLHGAQYSAKSEYSSKIRYSSKRQKSVCKNAGLAISSSLVAEDVSQQITSSNLNQHSVCSSMLLSPTIKGLNIRRKTPDGKSKLRHKVPPLKAKKTTCSWVFRITVHHTSKNRNELGFKNNTEKEGLHQRKGTADTALHLISVSKLITPYMKKHFRKKLLKVIPTLIKCGYFLQKQNTSPDTEKINFSGSTEQGISGVIKSVKEYDKENKGPNNISPNVLYQLQPFFMVNTDELKAPCLLLETRWKSKEPPKDPSELTFGLLVPKHEMPSEVTSEPVQKLVSSPQMKPNKRMEIQKDLQSAENSYPQLSKDKEILASASHRPRCSPIMKGRKASMSKVFNIPRCRGHKNLPPKTLKSQTIEFLICSGILSDRFHNKVMEDATVEKKKGLVQELPEISLESFTFSKLVSPVSERDRHILTCMHKTQKMSPKHVTLKAKKAKTFNIAGCETISHRRQLRCSSKTKMKRGRPTADIFLKAISLPIMVSFDTKVCNGIIMTDLLQKTRSNHDPRQQEESAHEERAWRAHSTDDGTKDVTHLGGRAGPLTSQLFSFKAHEMKEPHLMKSDLELKISATSKIPEVLTMAQELQQQTCATQSGLNSILNSSPFEKLQKRTASQKGFQDGGISSLSPSAKPWGTKRSNLTNIPLKSGGQKVDFSKKLRAKQLNIYKQKKEIILKSVFFCIIHQLSVEILKKQVSSLAILNSKNSITMVEKSSKKVSSVGDQPMSTNRINLQIGGRKEHRQESMCMTFPKSATYSLMDTCQITPSLVKKAVKAVDSSGHHTSNKEKGEQQEICSYKGLPKPASHSKTDLLQINMPMQRVKLGAGNTTHWDCSIPQTRVALKQVDVIDGYTQKIKKGNESQHLSISYEDFEEQISYPQNYLHHQPYLMAQTKQALSAVCTVSSGTKALDLSPKDHLRTVHQHGQEWSAPPVTLRQPRKQNAMLPLESSSKTINYENLLASDGPQVIEALSNGSSPKLRVGKNVEPHSEQKEAYLLRIVLRSLSRFISLLHEGERQKRSMKQRAMKDKIGPPRSALTRKNIVSATDCDNPVNRVGWQWDIKEKMTTMKHRKREPGLVMTKVYESIPSLPHFSLDKEKIDGVFSNNVKRTTQCIAHEEKDRAKPLEMRGIMGRNMTLKVEKPSLSHVLSGRELPLLLPSIKQDSKVHEGKGKSEVKQTNSYTSLSYLSHLNLHSGTEVGKDKPRVLRSCPLQQKLQASLNIKRIPFAESAHRDSLQNAMESKRLLQKKEKDEENIADVKDVMDLTCISLKGKSFPFRQTLRGNKPEQGNKKQEIMKKKDESNPGVVRNKSRDCILPSPHVEWDPGVVRNKSRDCMLPSPHVEWDPRIKEVYMQGVTQFCLPSLTLQELLEATCQEPTDDILSSIKRAKYTPQKDRMQTDSEEIAPSKRKNGEDTVQIKASSSFLQPKPQESVEMGKIAYKRFVSDAVSYRVKNTIKHMMQEEEESEKMENTVTLKKNTSILQKIPLDIKKQEEKLQTIKDEPTVASTSTCVPSPSYLKLDTRIKKAHYIMEVTRHSLLELLKQKSSDAVRKVSKQQSIEGNTTMGTQKVKEYMPQKEENKVKTLAKKDILHLDKDFEENKTFSQGLISTPKGIGKIDLPSNENEETARESKRQEKWDHNGKNQGKMDTQGKEKGKLDRETKEHRKMDPEGQKQEKIDGEGKEQAKVGQKSKEQEKIDVDDKEQGKWDQEGEDCGTADRDSRKQGDMEEGTAHDFEKSVMQPKWTPGKAKKSPLPYIPKTKKLLMTIKEQNNQRQEGGKKTFVHPKKTHHVFTSVISKLETVEEEDEDEGGRGGSGEGGDKVGEERGGGELNREEEEEGEEEEERERRGERGEKEEEEEEGGEEGAEEEDGEEGEEREQEDGDEEEEEGGEREREEEEEYRGGRGRRREPGIIKSSLPHSALQESLSSAYSESLAGHVWNRKQYLPQKEDRVQTSGSDGLMPPIGALSKAKPSEPPYMLTTKEHSTLSKRKESQRSSEGKTGQKQERTRNSNGVLAETYPSTPALHRRRFSPPETKLPVPSDAGQLGREGADEGISSRSVISSASQHRASEEAKDRVRREATGDRMLPQRTAPRVAHRRYFRTKTLLVNIKEHGKGPQQGRSEPEMVPRKTVLLPSQPPSLNRDNGASEKEATGRTQFCVQPLHSQRESDSDEKPRTKLSNRKEPTQSITEEEEKDGLAMGRKDQMLTTPVDPKVRKPQLSHTLSIKGLQRKTKELRRKMPEDKDELMTDLANTITKLCLSQLQCMESSDAGTTASSKIIDAEVSNDIKELKEHMPQKEKKSREKVARLNITVDPKDVCLMTKKSPILHTHNLSDLQWKTKEQERKIQEDKSESDIMPTKTSTVRSVLFLNVNTEIKEENEPMFTKFSFSKLIFQESSNSRRGMNIKANTGDILTIAPNGKQHVPQNQEKYEAQIEKSVMSPKHQEMKVQEHQDEPGVVLTKSTSISSLPQLKLEKDTELGDKMLRRSRSALQTRSNAEETIPTESSGGDFMADVKSKDDLSQKEETEREKTDRRGTDITLKSKKLLPSSELYKTEMHLCISRNKGKSLPSCKLYKAEMHLCMSRNKGKSLPSSKLYKTEMHLCISRNKGKSLPSSKLYKAEMHLCISRNKGISPPSSKLYKAEMHLCMSRNKGKSLPSSKLYKAEMHLCISSNKEKLFPSSKSCRREMHLCISRNKEKEHENQGKLQDVTVLRKINVSELSPPDLKLDESKQIDEERLGGKTSLFPVLLSALSDPEKTADTEAMNGHVRRENQSVSQQERRCEAAMVPLRIPVPCKEPRISPVLAILNAKECVLNLKLLDKRIHKDKGERCVVLTKTFLSLPSMPFINLDSRNKVDKGVPAITGSSCPQQRGQLPHAQKSSHVQKTANRESVEGDGKNLVKVAEHTVPQKEAEQPGTPNFTVIAQQSAEQPQTESERDVNSQHEDIYSTESGIRSGKRLELHFTGQKSQAEKYEKEPFATFHSYPTKDEIKIEKLKKENEKIGNLKETVSPEVSVSLSPPRATFGELQVALGTSESSKGFSVSERDDHGSLEKGLEGQCLLELLQKTLHQLQAFLHLSRHLAERDKMNTNTTTNVEQKKLDKDNNSIVNHEEGKLQHKSLTYFTPEEKNKPTNNLESKALEIKLSPWIPEMAKNSVQKCSFYLKQATFEEYQRRLYPRLEKKNKFLLWPQSLQTYSAKEKDKLLMHFSVKTLEIKMTAFPKIVRDSYAMVTAQEKMKLLPNYIHSALKVPKQKNKILLLFDEKSLQEIDLNLQHKHLHYLLGGSAKSTFPKPNAFPKHIHDLNTTCICRKADDSRVNCSLSRDTELLEQHITFRKQQPTENSALFSKGLEPTPVCAFDPGLHCVVQEDTRVLSGLKPVTPDKDKQYHESFQETNTHKPFDVNTQENATGLGDTQSRKISDDFTDTQIGTENSANVEECIAPEVDDSDENICLEANTNLNHESQKVLYEVQNGIPSTNLFTIKDIIPYLKSFNNKDSGPHHVRVCRKHTLNITPPSFESQRRKNYRSPSKMQSPDWYTSSGTLDIQSTTSCMSLREERLLWTTSSETSYSLSNIKVHAAKNQGKFYMYPESKERKKSRSNLTKKKNNCWDYDSGYHQTRNREKSTRKNKVCDYEPERSDYSYSQHKHKSTPKPHHEKIHHHPEKNQNKPFIYACIITDSMDVTPKTIRCNIPTNILKTNFRVPQVAKISSTRDMWSLVRNLGSS